MKFLDRVSENRAAGMDGVSAMRAAVVADPTGHEAWIAEYNAAKQAEFRNECNFDRRQRP